MAGQRPPANRTTILHLELFSHLKRVIYFDAEVDDCTFKLRVTRQQLDGTQVLRATIVQRYLDPAHRVRAAGHVIRAD